MKKVCTVIATVLVTAGVFAQLPEKMSYQAVIRNGNDQLVANTMVGMQISILQGATDKTTVYKETQTPTTNTNGLVTIEIGAGTVESGDFSTIDWADGPYYIKTETDPDGGSTYTITGTSQLLSVPFALHAKTVENITETDPDYAGSEAANITATDITNLSNLSGINSGDQDITGIAVNEQAIKDTASQIRADMPASGNTTGEMLYWDGSEWVSVPSGASGQFLSFDNGAPSWVTLVGVTVVGPTDVYNPVTGEIWMDRNLGASQVATSKTDAAAYGDLFQWGRDADGHESRTSETTSTLSTDDTPGHNKFITSANGVDWRSPQNDNLWQGVNGINNPCPSGYRLPTEAEWEAERASWSSDNADGAFGSPLKLTLGGNRAYTGEIMDVNVDIVGNYWTSTVAGTESRYVNINNSVSWINNNRRAWGCSVRCIKD